ALDHKIGEHFNQRLAVGYDFNQVTASYFGPLGFWGEPRGEYSETEWSHWTSSFDYGANFKASFRGGDISTTTSAGFQAANDVDKKLRLGVLDFPAPVDVPTLVFGSTRSVA